MIGQDCFRYTRNAIIWFGREELAEKSSTQEVYHMYMMWSFRSYPYTGDDESDKYVVASQVVILTRETNMKMDCTVLKMIIQGRV